MSFFKLTKSNIIFGALVNMIFWSFFRDAFAVLKYFIDTGSIPLWKVPIDYSRLSLFWLSRDVSALLWNIVWMTVMFTHRNLYKFLYYVLCSFMISALSFIVLGYNGIILASMVDLRLLNNIIAAAGIYFMSYRGNSQSYHLFVRAVFIYIMLSSINAFAAMLEYISLWPALGFRATGTFTQAAISGYVSATALAVLVLMRQNGLLQKHNLIFAILSVLFAIGAICTGTRAAMVAVFLEVGFYFYWNFYLRLKGKSIKMLFSVGGIILAVIIIPVFIYLAIFLANRGGDLLLSQQQHGRIWKFIRIHNYNFSKGLFCYLFGNGLSMGYCTAATALGIAVPPELQSVDGTINFVLAHSGILGLALLSLAVMVLVRNLLFQGIENIILVAPPIIFIGLAANWFAMFVPMIGLGLISGLINYKIQASRMLNLYNQYVYALFIKNVKKIHVFSQS